MSKGFQFKPFSRKQKKLLTWWMPGSPYHTYDVVIAEGSIRAGKTIAMIDSFLMWSLANFEGQNFILAGKTIGALKRNVLEPMFQILVAKGIPYKYVRSENTHVQIGTNVYYCFGGDNEKSQDKVQGLTAAGAYLDEVALMPKSFVDQCFGRCSVKGNKQFVNCNPGGPYHWFKTEHIDKADEKRALVLHFTMDDNLSLDEGTKEKYNRMFSGVFYRRYIKGEWVQAEGVVFSSFDNKKHVIEQIPSSFDYKMIGVDFGASNPTSFVKIGVKDGVYYQVDEYYHDAKKDQSGKSDKTIGQYAQDLVDFMDGDEYAIYIDPSAKAFINELRLNFSVKNVKKAVNDVVDGITCVNQLFHEGRLFIHPKCVDSLKELTSYVWDEKAGERGEDKPVKQNDHSCDARRYACYTDYLLRKAKEAAQKKKERKRPNRKRA